MYVREVGAEGFAVWERRVVSVEAMRGISLETFLCRYAAISYIANVLLGPKREQGKKRVLSRFFNNPFYRLGHSFGQVF